MSEIKIHTRNITKAFRASSIDDRVEGRSWYATARDVARTLDPSDPVRAAAVIAVLSPLLRWDKNVEAATDAYAGRRPRVLGANADKAARLLNGADPEDVVKGAKVRAFWLTIVDPTDPRTVVVDRHAIDVAAGRVLDDETRGKVLGRKGAYDEVSDAYRRAAVILTRETGSEWSPAEIQATVWVYWRRKGKHA